MSEVKYEAVFGNLDFDDFDLDTAAVCDCGDFLLGITEDELKSRTLSDFRNEPIIAMRRIIKTPVWTADDKSSGRYPPVGVSAFVPGVCVCEVIGSSEEYEQIAIKYRDGSLDVINCNELTPIETPEQLAATLRDIWVSKVCEDICYHHTGDAEVIRSISMIYDAILSGDLPVPGKDGE